MSLKNLTIKKLVDEKEELKRKSMMQSRGLGKTLHFTVILNRLIVIEKQLKKLGVK